MPLSTLALLEPSEMQQAKVFGYQPTDAEMLTQFRKWRIQRRLRWVQASTSARTRLWFRTVAPNYQVDSYSLRVRLPAVPVGTYKSELLVTASWVYFQPARGYWAPWDSVAIPWTRNTSQWWEWQLWRALGSYGYFHLSFDDIKQNAHWAWTPPYLFALQVTLSQVRFYY